MLWVLLSTQLIDKKIVTILRYFFYNVQTGIKERTFQNNEINFNDNNEHEQES